MNRQQARIAIHIAAVLFGLTGILGELIQGGAVMITAGRATFAVVALFAFMRLKTAIPRQAIQWRHARVLIAAGCLLAIHWVTFFVAVKVSGVAIATLGFASFPAFITVFESVVFKEKVGRGEWLIIVLVTLGLLLVTPAFDIRTPATVGLVWAIASGLSFALFTVTNRRAAGIAPAQQVACWENLVVALLTLPFGFNELIHIGALDWLWLALLGVFCTALSHYLLVSSLMVLKARSAGIVIALEPIYAIVFAAILFAQYPSARALFGGALIIGAILWSGRLQAARQITRA